MRGVGGLFVWGFEAEGLESRLIHNALYSLRKNDQALAELREKLFILWGDLEERKTREAAAVPPPPPPATSDAVALPSSTRTETAVNKQAVSENSAAVPNRREIKIKNENRDGDGGMPLAKPFSCCVAEYGVRVWGKGGMERRHAVCKTTIS